MSDGHFNRALLPKTDYQSGVNIGTTRTRRQAEEAFARIIESHFSDSTQEVKLAAQKAFHQELFK